MGGTLTSQSFFTALYGDFGEIQSSTITFDEKYFLQSAYKQLVSRPSKCMFPY